jgi:predicted ATPase
VRERADGNPFFAEELVHMMRDTGLILIEGEECQLRPDAGDVSTWNIPRTVEGTILSRIDRLTAQQQLTLKVASVVGRVFPYRTLYDIHPIEEDRVAIAGHFDVLERLDLTPLERTEPDRAYIFKHVITHEVSYNLLPYTQRRHLHREAAQWYERTHAHDLSPLYPLLAYHWRRAAEDRTPDAVAAVKAIDYLQHAGDRAARGFLEPEAVRFYREAIELTGWLLEGPERSRKELQLQLAAGAVMIATKGYAAEEVRQAYTRARELCRQVGDRALLFRALRGLWAFHIGRAEFEEAIVLSRQLLRLAEEDTGTEVLMEAHRAMGNAIFWIGDLMTAREHMQRAIDLYVEDRDRTLAFLYGQDPNVANRGMQAWPLALQGQPKEALRRGEEAVAHARELGHPYTLGYALVHDMCCRQFLQQVGPTLQRAEEVVALAGEKGFPNWLLAGMVLRGWALGHQGKAQEGLELMAHGVGLWRSFGSGLVVPYFLALQAEMLCLARRAEEGLALLDEALAVGERNNDRWHEAEAHRLRGVCLRQLGRKAEAEEALRCAVESAQRQGAELFSQRAEADLTECMADSPGVSTNLLRHGPRT